MKGDSKVLREGSTFHLEASISGALPFAKYSSFTFSTKDLWERMRVSECLSWAHAEGQGNSDLRFGNCMAAAKGVLGVVA